jgi:thiamine pyrophosphokinase
VLKIVILDDFSTIFALNRYFEKWYVAGTLLSLIPVGTVIGIQTKGLKYNLYDEILALGYRTGSSNEAEKDGFVTIKYQCGDLLLMECRD